MRRTLIALVRLLALTAPVAAATPDEPVVAVSAAWAAPSVATVQPTPRGRWGWPLDPRPAIARGFAAPSDPWGAGHRGVDLGPVAPESPVHAVEDGVVSHVGVIAGRGTITVTHSSGVRSTYEPVRAHATQGQSVARGALLGWLESAGSHCAPEACLHLGAIRGATYLDPMRLIERRRIILLPLPR